MITRLQSWATERRYRIAFGNIHVLQEVRSLFEQLRNTGEVNRDFFAENLTFFRYEDSAPNLAELKAVIVVAIPRPAHQLTFELPTGHFDTILPPTYLRYRAVFQDVRDEIIATFPELSGHLEILLAPLKSVASRLGLVTYGKNNVTYIPEWGSYFQLAGYVADVDIGACDIAPQTPRLMPECENCMACNVVCPTGAISNDRILLHAECCKTLCSERRGDLKEDLVPNCLFGCLECQQYCPVNDGKLHIEPASVSFDQKETAAILAGDNPPSVSEKLARLGLTEEPLIPRNLAHLVARASGGAPHGPTRNL